MVRCRFIPSASSSVCVFGLVLYAVLCWGAGPGAAEGGFVPTELDPGDKVLAWTVDEVRTYTDAAGSYCSVEFSGQTELAGRYEVLPPAINMEPRPCFFPDDASAALLPRARRDIRRAWFCFLDPAHALEALGQENRTARVVIDSYRYIFVPYDAFNEARLLEVPAP